MRIIAKTSPLESPQEEGFERPSLEVVNDEPKVENSQASTTDNTNDDQTETRRGLERLMQFIKKEARKPKILAPERQVFFDKAKSIQKYIKQIESQDQDNQKGMAFDIAA